MARPAPFSTVADDEAILNFIFDPRRSFIGAAPPPSASETAERAARAADAENTALAAKELAAAGAADSGDTSAALRIINEVIAHSPSRASAYNNRAQIQRLRGDAAAAVSDLDRAIALARAQLESGVHPALHRDVLQQAYTQRALCHHDAGELEAEAADLAAAAAYGSQLAAMMTSQTNPYATLCSATVALMLSAAVPAPERDDATSAQPPES